MPNQFFLLIDKKSQGDLIQFKDKSYNEETKNILAKNLSNHLWAFRKERVKGLWNKIKKNDIVFFTVKNEPFEYYGIVSKKSIGNYTAYFLYPDNLDAKEMNYFLFFDKLEKCNESFSELTSYSEEGKISKHSVGDLYKLKNEFWDNFKKKIQPRKKTERKTKVSSFVWSETPDKPADRASYEVFRYVRINRKDVLDLKNLYQNKCQICGVTYEYAKNKFYSEVHHYKPIHEHGHDHRNNMIVLCPNHHTQFDFKLMFIDVDRNTLLDKDGKTLGDKITFCHGHKLDITNIESQLR